MAEGDTLEGTAGMAKATPGSERYKYGSPEEVARRQTDGYSPTESHFSQIRPERFSGTPSIDEQNGRTPGANAPVKRNGNLGK